MGSYGDYITAEVRVQNLRTLIDEKLEVAEIDESVQGVAIRLQQRLAKRGIRTIPLSNLAEATWERRALLRHTVNVELRADDGAIFELWLISLQDHPYWIKPIVTPSTLGFIVDTKRVQFDLEEFGIPHVPKPVTSTITDVIQDGAVERAVTDKDAKDGYTFNISDVGDAMTDALAMRIPSIQLDIRHTAGPIINASGRDLGPLQYIATGRSNFKGSGGGRIHNVRKGLNERMHNILVPPGETFSFNNSLGKVIRSAGWQEALGIFNGNELRPVTGGGICQVATTVYRAALLSGLPIAKRKSHSLYVSYYEKYGVGIDATVFQGSQDLQFVNDTNSYLLIQSFADGFEAFVEVYGAPDGRSVTLTGPYFSANAPSEFNDGKKLRSNEIGWSHEVRYPDGSFRLEPILSRYKTIPKSLLTTYAEPTTHAAAKVLTDPK